MSYSPTLERWIEPDPTGAEYVDGANLYQAELSDPIRYTDPEGTRVQIIEALPGNNGATTQPATNLVDIYKQRLDGWIDAFKQVPESKYLDIQKAEKITWAGTAFSGTKAEFLARMEREKTSEVIEFGNGNLKAFDAKLTDLIKQNSESWDDTAVAIHGVYDSDTGKPLNLVDVNGDQENQVDALKAIRVILQQAKGVSVVISCFDNPQGLEESIASDGRFGLEQHANNDDASQCIISFVPLKLKAETAGAPSTQPSQP